MARRKSKNNSTKKHAPIHPGEVLRHDFMEPMGITAYRLAKGTGISAMQIGRILRGASGVTAQTALRLARYFGTSPELWMDLQSRYELDTAIDEAGKAIEREVTPHNAA